MADQNIPQPAYQPDARKDGAFALAREQVAEKIQRAGDEATDSALSARVTREAFAKRLFEGGLLTSLLERGGVNDAYITATGREFNGQVGSARDGQRSKDNGWRSYGAGRKSDAGEAEEGQDVSRLKGVAAAAAAGEESRGAVERYDDTAWMQLQTTQERELQELPALAAEIDVEGLQSDDQRRQQASKAQLSRKTRRAEELLASERPAEQRQGAELQAMLADVLRGQTDATSIAQRHALERDLFEHRRAANDYEARLRNGRIPTPSPGEELPIDQRKPEMSLELADRLYAVASAQVVDLSITQRAGQLSKEDQSIMAEGAGELSALREMMMDEARSTRMSRKATEDKVRLTTQSELLGQIAEQAGSAGQSAFDLAQDDGALLGGGYEEYQALEAVQELLFDTQREYDRLFPPAAKAAVSEQIVEPASVDGEAAEAAEAEKSPAAEQVPAEAQVELAPVAEQAPVAASPEQVQVQEVAEHAPAAEQAPAGAVAEPAQAVEQAPVVAEAQGEAVKAAAPATASVSAIQAARPAAAARTGQAANPAEAPAQAPEAAPKQAQTPAAEQAPVASQPAAQAAAAQAQAAPAQEAAPVAKQAVAAAPTPAAAQVQAAPVQTPTRSSLQPQEKAQPEPPTRFNAKTATNAEIKAHLDRLAATHSSPLAGLVATPRAAAGATDGEEGDRQKGEGADSATLLTPKLQALVDKKKALRAEQEAAAGQPEAEQLTAEQPVAEQAAPQAERAQAAVAAPAAQPAPVTAEQPQDERERDAKAAQAPAASTPAAQKQEGQAAAAPVEGASEAPAQAADPQQDFNAQIAALIKENNTAKIRELTAERVAQQRAQKQQEEMLAALNAGDFEALAAHAAAAEQAKGPGLTLAAPAASQQAVETAAARQTQAQPAPSMSAPRAEAEPAAEQPQAAQQAPARARPDHFAVGPVGAGRRETEQESGIDAGGMEAAAERERANFTDEDRARLQAERDNIKVHEAVPADQAGYEKRRAAMLNRRAEKDAEVQSSDRFLSAEKKAQREHDFAAGADKAGAINERLCEKHKETFGDRLGQRRQQTHAPAEHHTARTKHGM